MPSSMTHLVDEALEQLEEVVAAEDDGTQDRTYEAHGARSLATPVPAGIGRMPDVPPAEPAPAWTCGTGLRLANGGRVSGRRRRPVRAPRFRRPIGRSPDVTWAAFEEPARHPDRVRVRAEEEPRHRSGTARRTT
jgi:hypothetical protein